MFAVASRHIVWILVASCMGLVWGVAARAQPAAAPLDWTLHSSDAPVRITAHRHDDQVPAGDRPSELVQIEAGPGTFVYFAHAIDPSAVIAEFAPRVWVQTDRPGVQLLARVVLPRTQAPEGGPLTVFVPGETCQERGVWRQIGLGNLPAQLEREVRVMRVERRIAIDEREAYVDGLLLNCYGGQGATQVWVGSLEIAGQVRPGNLAQGVQGMVVSRSAIEPDLELDPATGRVTGIVPHQPSAGPPAPWQPSPPHVERNPIDIELQGSLLTVAGQPFSPRAIVYQGEPLAWLKERGFNSVWLESPPSAALAAEARLHGMLLVGPSPTGMRPGGADARRLPEMTLGVFLPTSEAMTAADATYAAGELERAKSTEWRPLVARAGSSAPQVCRVTDILLVGRAPLGTSLELADEPACLAAQGLLARPGTPCWAEVQTEPSAAIERQMELLAHSWLPRVSVEPEQIRLLTYSALASGARGVVYQSNHRLDGDQPQDRLRAATLTLLNRELAVLSPWIAASTSRTVIETSDPDTRAVLLNMDRAKLLVVLRCPRYAQMVTGEPAAESTSVVVPGVPPSYMIFRVKPTALETLEGQRVTGGMRVVINEPEPVSLVLLSGDSRASATLSRSLATESRAVAEQEVFLARQMMTLVENVDQQLTAARTPRPPRAEQQLAAAQRQLDHGVQLLESNDASGCLRMIRQSESTLRRLRWQHWALAAESETSPLSLPFTTNFAMLPYHWSAHENVGSASTGPNLLVGGEMESIEQLMAAGWRHAQPEGETASVDVRLIAPAHSGQSALRLSAKQPQRAGMGPPLAIVSPAVAFEPGQLVCFRCWVRAVPPPEGGASLEIETWPGGPELAERVRVAPQWRELKLYRVIDDDGQARLTFRLLGPGEAWVDEVSITPVEFSQSALTSGD